MDWLSFQQAIADLNLELFLTILLVIVLFIFGLVVGRWSLRRELMLTDNQDKARKSWWNTFWQGISTELFGAVLTTVGFGLVLVIFQQYQTIQDDKVDLILQMGSPDNTFAVEAARIAGQKRWLYDGSLEGANLWFANLSEARLVGANLAEAILSDADLERVVLIDANLEGAILSSANLKGAFLSGANLEQSFLFGANLEGAFLSNANLSDATLGRVNLENANLWLANLIGADFQFANLENMTLPDETIWSSGMTMARFTDPDHPQFSETLAVINDQRISEGLQPFPDPNHGE